MTAINGPEIYKALQSVGRLHGHVSTLLHFAVDALSGSAGFTRLQKDSTAIAGGSSALNKPHKWMPEAAFQFLRHPDRPRHAVFVSVVLCPYKAHVPFTEPLVSAGWVKFATDVRPAKWGGGDYRWARMITWAPGERDGRPIRWTVDWEKEKVEECCLAKPLVLIQDEATLVYEILAPLVRSLELPVPPDWTALDSPHPG